MQITLIPQAALPGVAETTVSVAGDTLTIDGVNYNLGMIPEGGQATFEPEDHEPNPFVGKITRIDGAVALAILFQFDASTAAPHQPKELVTVSLTSGPLPDPITRLPLEILP